MAGYGYTYRGGYTTYNGGAPRSEGWTNTSYTSDHTCQPVFVDGDGRRKPIIAFSPDGSTTEYYVTKTEIVDIPYVTEYKQSTPIRVEVLRDYGDVEGKRNRPLSPEKWRKSSSPVRYHAEEKWVRPSSPIRYHTEEKWVKPSSPVRYHTEEKWIRPSSPVRYHIEEKGVRPSSPVWSNRPSSPIEERPQQVEDFITKIQTQASRPNNFGPLSATYWRQAPNSCPGYGDQGDLSNKQWQKPSYQEPTTMTTNAGDGGSWGAKPTNGGPWPKGQRANLSQPTSDISTAMEYLKEAAKPSSAINAPPSRYSMPAPPMGPKRDGYPPTIDSREAERKYGRGSLNVAASRTVDNYARTIDSREAARKYGGTTV